ncbi:MAG TPA: hypothetical protein VG929_00410 [Actinomycetota bacterium]|nr:hypothetical protein [Actinomycetota bacterium]
MSRLYGYARARLLTRGIGFVCIAALGATACDAPGVAPNQTVSPDGADGCPGAPEIPTETIAARSGPSGTTIAIDPNERLRHIERGVYGINHRYPYAGFGTWDVANNRPYPNFVENVRYAGFTIMRFPGGRMANPYRWKRAIGPVEQRRDNPNGGGTGDPLTNEFGPDEFGRLMQLTESEGSIVANFATGTPQEAADWVEYMNSPVGANPNGGEDWAAVRAANGSEEPYGAKYWEIGNEMNSDKVYWMGEDQTEQQKATKYIFGGETSFKDHKLGTLTAHSHAGATSNGEPDLVRYLRYPPARPGTDQVYVDGDPWKRVDSLSSAGKTNVYEFDPRSGRVRFGDGVNGNIPPEGALLTADYVSGPHAGFLDYYREMKAVDPALEIGSAIHTETFTQLMGAEHPYDFMVVHTYGSFKDAPEQPKHLHDYLMLLPDDQRDYIAASQRQIERGAGAERSAEIDVGITEYAAGSGLNDGINSIDAPKRYLLSLDGALYTALLIRHWIDLGIPLAQKHSLVDTDPDNPPEGYTRSRTSDAAVIGPAPCFIASASAHVFKMYTQMLGPTQVAVEIDDSPTRKIRDGRSLDALVAVATVDEQGKPAVLVVNRDRKRAVPATVSVAGQAVGRATVWTLGARHFLDYNTERHPNRVRLFETVVEGLQGALWHRFPAHSVTAISFDL